MSANQILVVEDEGIVATALKNELEQFGYHVPNVASSAAEAVEKAVREKPDLVLMDIHLKGEKDGIEAAGEIRRRCGIPVVYLSAFADSETVARAGATEAFGYLLKPYEERELHTTITVALAKHRAEQRLEENKRWLSAILEGIDDAVIATDPDSKIQFMNIAGEALTGWRKEDAVGAPFAAVCNLVDNGRRLLLEDLAGKAICESRTVELPATVRLDTRKGLDTPIKGRLAPIHDSRGEFLGEVLTLRNINARLSSTRRGTRPTILLAEADAIAREFGRLVLEEQGYQVLIAEDGVRAVEVFRQAEERIDLVIVDLNIPGLACDTALEQLWRLDPNIEVLYSSVYFAEDLSESGGHVLGVISKPFVREELINVVKTALARREEVERINEKNGRWR